MEENVYPQPEIKQLMSGFVVEFVDLTDQTDNAKLITDKFDVIGPPVILFFKNGTLLETRVDGGVDSKAFAEILKSI